MENDTQATLSQMRKQFIVNLPDRLDILKTLLTNLEHGQRESIEALYRAAHSLVSSAGGSPFGAGFRGGAQFGTVRGNYTR